MLENIRENSEKIAEELLEKAKLKKGQIVVVGCSTSEVQGQRIGSSSEIEIAEAIYVGLNKVFQKNGIIIAAQCCEHLNRAIILEREYASGLEEVNVRPSKKAGGAFATKVYESLNSPVAVEFIKADAGIDIGDTLIGMHLKHVAVPIRTEIKNIGKARVTSAKTRCKFIGGERAIYNSYNI